MSGDPLDRLRRVLGAFSEQQSAEFIDAFTEAMFSTINESSERENLSSSPNNIKEEIEVEMKEQKDAGVQEVEVEMKEQKDAGVQEENPQDVNIDSSSDLAAGRKRKGKQA